MLLRLAGDPAGGLPGERLARLARRRRGAFLVVGLAAMLAGRPFLGYPVDLGRKLILAIETAATFGIAATLVTAFLCGRTGAVPRNNESASMPDAATR